LWNQLATRTVFITMKILAAALLGALVVGCVAQRGVSPSPSPSLSQSVGSPAASQSEATDGLFKLAFSLRGTSWSASEAIEGTASLSVSAPVEVGGSGEGLLGFNYVEIGGLGRRIEWAETADCRPYQLESGQPMTTGLKKAGGYDAAAPGAGFYASFFADPAVHLPVGNWTITALATFIDYSKAGGCQLPSHDMSVPITIHVGP